MSKYSNEFKLKVIEFYQKENYVVKVIEICMKEKNNSKS